MPTAGPFNVAITGAGYARMASNKASAWTLKAAPSCLVLRSNPEQNVRPTPGEHHRAGGPVAVGEPAPHVDDRGHIQGVAPLRTVHDGYHHAVVN